MIAKIQPIPPKAFTPGSFPSAEVFTQYLENTPENEDPWTLSSLRVAYTFSLVVVISININDAYEAVKSRQESLIEKKKSLEEQLSTAEAQLGYAETARNQQEEIYNTFAAEHSGGGSREAKELFRELIALTETVLSVRTAINLIKSGIHSCVAEEHQAVNELNQLGVKEASELYLQIEPLRVTGKLKIRSTQETVWIGDLTGNLFKEAPLSEIVFIEGSPGVFTRQFKFSAQMNKESEFHLEGEPVITDKDQLELEISIMGPSPVQIKSTSQFYLFEVEKTGKMLNVKTSELSVAYTRE